MLFQSSFGESSIHDGACPRYCKCLSGDPQLNYQFGMMVNTCKRGAQTTDWECTLEGPSLSTESMYNTSHDLEGASVPSALLVIGLHACRVLQGCL